MIRLASREAAWHVLGAGAVRVLARPLDTPTWTMVEAAVRNQIETWRAEKESGDATISADIENEQVRAAIRESMTINAVLVASIVEFDGFVDGDGAALKATPDSIAEFVHGFPLLATDLYRRLLVPWADLVTEKNASALAPNGTSVAGRNTAETVPTKDSLAPTADPVSTENAART